jgi:hypothetical protein
VQDNCKKNSNGPLRLLRAIAILNSDVALLNCLSGPEELEPRIGGAEMVLKILAIAL